MYINSQLSTCVGTQSPKYIEMAQGHISLSYPKLELGLSAMSKDDLADSLVYNSLKVHILFLVK
jgi:hypothetical protein